MYLNTSFYAEDTAFALCLLVKSRWLIYLDDFNEADSTDSIHVFQVVISCFFQVSS